MVKHALRMTFVNFTWSWSPSRGPSEWGVSTVTSALTRGPFRFTGQPGGRTPDSTLNSEADLSSTANAAHVKSLGSMTVRS